MTDPTTTRRSGLASSLLWLAAEPCSWVIVVVALALACPVHAQLTRAQAIDCALSRPATAVRAEVRGFAIDWRNSPRDKEGQHGPVRATVQEALSEWLPLVGYSCPGGPTTPPPPATGEFATGYLWDWSDSEPWMVNALRKRGSIFRVHLPLDGGCGPDAALTWGHGHTARDAAELSAAKGFEVLWVIGLHATGDASGTGFHRTRDPITHPPIVARCVEDLLAWLATVTVEDRAPIVYGVEIDNEFEFLPGSADVTPWFEKYMAVLLAVDQAVEVPRLVVGGLSGVGGLNEYVASRRPATRNPLIYDIHGNGWSDDRFRAEIRGLRAYGVTVGVYEDADLAGRHATTPWYRAPIAKEEGAVAWLGFGRWMQSPWGASAQNKLDCRELGIEGPGGWSAVHYRAATKAAQEVGTWEK